MRIVHIMLTRYFAGTERHVLELSKAQAQQHEVHLLLHRKGCGDGDRAIAPRVAADVQVHQVGNPLRQWTFVQVRQQLKKLQPDIIHCHLNAACKSVRGLRLLAPKVATLHIDYAPEQHDHMQGLIAITPFQQQRACEHSPALTSQIDNWIEPHSLNQLQSQALRERAGIGANEFVIGTLGRIEKDKQQDIVIEAALQAARRVSRPCRIVVVGDGREMAELKARYPEVLFTGFSRAAKTWLGAFDLFVSAAREEPFGLVYLEALQARTPVITNNTEGARHLARTLPLEIVSGAEPRALCNVLSEAISRRVESGPQRVDEQRVTALADFSLEQKSQQTLAFYDRLLSTVAG